MSGTKDALPLLMRDKSLLLASPGEKAEQLILLFHGAGANPEQMVPLGEKLAAAYPHAWVVSVCAPESSDGERYHWYSLEDVNEENHLQRMIAAMPAFLATISHWQKTVGIGADRTALVGFSQGAIMALESSHEQPVVASRVASIGGRFLRLPEPVGDATTYFLLHGKEDEVISYGYTVKAAEYLAAREGDVVADVIPFRGHEITPDLIDLLLERLQGHVPRRLWKEALRADAPLRKVDDSDA